MKIVVYAICKDEEKFVDRWVASMSEADKIVVLDTGSSDRTVEMLKARGVEVTCEEIKPWRFDTARNRSLELVDDDADICVCTDLDEVFHPGWRELLEKAWKKGAAIAKYRYTWNFTPEGKEGVVFWYEKIHTRHGFRWTHPVHEVLEWVGEGDIGFAVYVEGMQLDHRADPEKSRAQYLPLLELSVAEDPDDDRNMHYLGREYMFKGRWRDCIATLKKHLAMPTALWKDERAASMRFIAKSYYMSGEEKEAEKWYLSAICEAPHLREGYADMAMLLYKEKNWEGVIYFSGKALEIKVRPRTYICEAEAWGSMLNDIRSIAYYNMGKTELALREAREALEAEPGNTRIRDNLRFFEETAEKERSRVRA